MSKKTTPAQRFKQLFNLSFDELTTPKERENAQRKWQEWLKRYGKKPIDIASILAQAERDDAAANPPPPPSPPSPDPPHPFDDPNYNAATLIEQITGKYLVMRPHAHVIYVLWIIATHVHEKFAVAPRVLLTSEEPESGKTTALEVARHLMLRANEESFATEAALREHLGRGACSIALDEGDLYEPAARRALLRLWNGGHARGTKHGMMVGGRRRLFNLFAPMIAAGLGRILGRAQLSRTLVLSMSRYHAGEEPELNWWAPADSGPHSAESRETDFAALYAYLQHCATNWTLDRRPPMPPGVIGRSADNFRSLLAVADICGKDWPRRAREAIVALISEMNAERPQAIILRHGLMLFNNFETDWLEVGHFNQELRRLSAPEFDWTNYRGASGLEMNRRPISIREQGRLLGAAGIKSHSMWPPGVSFSERQPRECQRVYRRAEFEEALRRTEPSSPVLRLVKP